MLQYLLLKFLFTYLSIWHFSLSINLSSYNIWPLCMPIYLPIYLSIYKQYLSHLTFYLSLFIYLIFLSNLHQYIFKPDYIQLWPYPRYISNNIFCKPSIVLIYNYYSLIYNSKKLHIRFNFLNSSFSLQSFYLTIWIIHLSVNLLILYISNNPSIYSTLTDILIYIYIYLTIFPSANQLEYQFLVLLKSHISKLKSNIFVLLRNKSLNWKLNKKLITTQFVFLLEGRLSIPVQL